MKRPLVRNLGVAVLLAGALVLAVAPGALAGKGGGKPGGGGSGSSVSLVLLNSTDGVPHWGQQVTFNVSTTATDRPYVQLSCYQSGVRVYTFQAGFYAGYPWTTVYTLSSASWTGGAADCTATLVATGRRTTTLATSSFHVYA